MHQIVQRLGLCPRPHWRSSQSTANPIAGKAEEGERRGGNKKGEGREARGVAFLNLSMAVRNWFACNVCKFIVRGAGLRLVLNF